MELIISRCCEVGVSSSSLGDGKGLPEKQSSWRPSWGCVASGSSGLLTQAVGALPTASSCRDGNLDIAGGMAAEQEVMSVGAVMRAG